MKRVFIVVVLSVFIFGCSKSPMDRLQNYNSNDPKTFLTKEDEAYWTNAAKNNTKEFQEAVSYCKGKPDHLNSGCFLINEILTAPKVEYGQYPIHQTGS